MAYRASARLSVKELSQRDLEIYERVLPEKSVLLSALELIDWSALEQRLLSYYSRSGRGQPPYPPVIFLKMEFLKSLYAMSQRECVQRCACDLHLKYFLGLPVDAGIVDQSGMTRFRKRVGAEGFREVFDALIAQARAHRLVSDRLRLKDATHIIGDVAVPSTLRLFAQLRERMLTIVAALDESAAADFQLQADTVRSESASGDDASKLAARVAMVEDILVWLQQEADKRIDEKPPGTQDDQTNDEQRSGGDQESLSPSLRRRLQETIELAAKVLGDRKNSSGGDRTISVVDPDVRCGKHGEYYDGYLLDVMMDAQSELITALEVLPANGQEAADALQLVEQEEQAHGNDVKMLSMDGIGFNGEVAEHLECSEEGPRLMLFAPPHPFNENPGWATECFEVIDDGQRVRCPAGQESMKGQKVPVNPHRRVYEFSASACRNCALRAECDPARVNNVKRGRRVWRNDFNESYRRLRQRAESELYRQVRSEHGAIERKLNEIVRHHGGRKARYRGQAKVFMQQAMIAFAVNVKRMVRLLGGHRAAPPRAVAPLAAMA